MQLRGVQEKWALDSQLQPLSLRVGKLVEKLAPLLHDSIFYLNLSDPEYLRRKSVGGGPISSGAHTAPGGIHRRRLVQLQSVSGRLWEDL